jgi:hypothetical protein
MPTTTTKQIKDYVKAEFGELTGKTVKTVRPLTKVECDDMYWPSGGYDVAVAIIFTDGTAAVVSQDPEGNGPGWLLLADTKEVSA